MSQKYIFIYYIKHTNKVEKYVTHLNIFYLSTSHWILLHAYDWWMVAGGIHNFFGGGEGVDVEILISSSNMNSDKISCKLSSLMQFRNNIGDRTDFWGTPIMILQE